MNARLAISALALLVGLSSVQAASDSFNSDIGFYQASPGVSGSAGASSARTQIPAPTNGTLIVYNTGTNDIYVRLGDATVVATAADNHIVSGGWMAFAPGGNSFIATIQGAGSSTFNLLAGWGTPHGSGAGGGSGGGGGSNASVGANNTTAPTSSTQLGCQDASGNLQPNSKTNPCFVSGNVIQANNSVHKSISSATTTNLISTNSTFITYITFYHAFVDATAGGNASIQLVYGTGTSCTSPTALTEVETYTVGNGTNEGIGLGPVFLPVPNGSNVCAITGTANLIKLRVAFVQQ